MADGKVVAICISPVAGKPLREIQEALAISGEGLQGDRYCRGEGSFNQKRKGQRQITLINGVFFEGTVFDYVDSRRNIVTLDVELMDLIGKEFMVGDARLRGLRYCDPCMRPTKLSGKKAAFKDAFHDRGGLIAEVVEGGLIKVGALIVPPKKSY